jgi:hypothetical protein
MSKPKPPKPANDHLAAFGGRGDDLASLTDQELDARLEASRIARDRAFKLMILRMRETSLANIHASLVGETDS